MALKKIIDSKSYRKFKGADWPQYDDFINDNYSVSPTIDNELSNFVGVMEEHYKDIASKSTEELSTSIQTRQDQVFYNKSYTGTNRCREPWETMGVNENGNVFLCACSSWIPIFLGTVLDSKNIYEILNCNQAKKIRFEILKDRYYYCNSSICTFFQSANPASHKKTYTDTDQIPLELDDQDDSNLCVTQIPKNLVFDFDISCNFKCPSCRVEYQNYNNDLIIRPINDTISEKIKKLIIDEIKDQPIIIRWAGGEPFISDVYLELLDYIIDSGKTNIQNIIHTNGSVLIAKKDLVLKLLPYISELRISFDAGCEQTYKLTRVGGQWDNLLKNVKFVKDLIEENNFKTKLSADFVVQKSNYKDLPLFANLCREFGLSMNIQKMWNWDTWDKEVFYDMNVYDSKHYLYDDLKEYFKLANLPMAEN